VRCVRARARRVISAILASTSMKTVFAAHFARGCADMPSAGLAAFVVLTYSLIKTRAWLLVDVSLALPFSACICCRTTCLHLLPRFHYPATTTSPLRLPLQRCTCWSLTDYAVWVRGCGDGTRLFTGRSTFVPLSHCRPSLYGGSGRGSVSAVAATGICRAVCTPTHLSPSPCNAWPGWALPRPLTASAAWLSQLDFARLAGADCSPPPPPLLSLAFSYRVDL